MSIEIKDDSVNKEMESVRLQREIGYLESEKAITVTHKLQPLCQKIEHARRNIEVMIKLGAALTDKTDGQVLKLIEEVTTMNLKILKETINIK